MANVIKIELLGGKETLFKERVSISQAESICRIENARDPDCHYVIKRSVHEQITLNLPETPKESGM